MLKNIIKNKELAFNEKCWKLLKLIPQGKITTYKLLAEALETKAYQAVGNAMASNPNPIKVPCHRVVKSNGELGGFALGTDKKIELLKQEGIAVKEGKVVDLTELLFDFKNLD